MPDEETPSVALKDFGDLGEIFNKVFPATATETQNGAASPGEPPPEAPARAPVAPQIDPGRPEEAKEPEPAPKPVEGVLDDILPGELFGEKKPEAEAPKEVPVPAGITKPKDIATWKELRHRLDTAEAEMPKWKSEAEQWKSKYETVQPDMLQAKLAETEQMNKQLSERIAVVDLQLHPEFQRQFVQPRAALVSGAIELAKDADIEPAQFEAAMRLSGKARIEALDEIVEQVGSPSLKAQLGAKLNELQDLDRKRNGALADAQGNWQRLQEHDKAHRYEVLQQEQKQMGSMVEELTNKFANEHKMVFFRKLEGNPDWNRSFDEEDKLARDIVTVSKDPRQLVAAVRMGVTAPRMYNTIITLRERLTKALAEISELKSSDPSLGGRRETVPSGGEAEQPQNLSFADAVARGSGLR